MQNSFDDETPRMPNVFVRPTESWSLYQARLLHLLEEAGLRPGHAPSSELGEDREEAAPAGQNASGRS
jgi:hypothetical protein